MKSTAPLQSIPGSKSHQYKRWSSGLQAKKLGKCLVFAANVAAISSIPSALAATHVASLPAIIVTGNGWDFNGASFSPGFGGVVFSFPPAMHPEYQLSRYTINLSTVCGNPFISSAAKQTTSKSDVTHRWLAAQELFNTIVMKNLWGTYKSATQIKLVINGKTYDGFSVAYADGVREVWAVNPGFAQSTIKLMDTPMPDSMGTPNKPESCTA